MITHTKREIFSLFSVGSGTKNSNPTENVCSTSPSSVAMSIKFTLFSFSDEFKIFGDGQGLIKKKKNISAK